MIRLSHMTMFTVDIKRRVTMLEGALIWDAACDKSRWYVGMDVYDVFNRLGSAPEGQIPPFLEPLESVLTGKATADYQEHEIGRHFS